MAQGIWYLSTPPGLVRHARPPSYSTLHDGCIHLFKLDFHLVPGDGRRNYTGFVTKTIVYSASFFVCLVSFGLTLASILLPRWLSYRSETPTGTHFDLTYGLTQRCSSLSHTCEDFPQYEDCQPSSSPSSTAYHGIGAGIASLLTDNRTFCSIWKSAGFLMSLAIVLLGMTIMTYVVILGGGKQMRETGWRILTVFLVLVGLVQCAGMALVSYLYDNDDRFYPGWKLDDSWIMCTVSMCLAFINAAIVYTSARVLPSEGGYELIADHD